MFVAMKKERSGSDCISECMSTLPSNALEDVPGLLDHLTNLPLFPNVLAVFLRGTWGFDRDERAKRTCRHRSSKAVGIAKRRSRE